MAKKPRSDSKLLTLEDEVQLRIFEWLRHVGYEKTRLLVKKEYEIKTSVGALHNFWEHWSKKESESRILKAVTAANDTVEAMADHLPLLNQASQAALQQATFEAILSGSDPKTIKDFSNILLKSRALDQAEQTLQLRIREFEQKVADAQGVLDKARKDGGMTAEAIAAMEEALGML